MAHTAPGMTVSEILRTSSGVDEDEPKKKSREDWRKAKELEEARKAGTAPAAVDEEGKDINPHIPQYISTAPWYYGSCGPTLKHQRQQPERLKDFSKLDEWYKRGVDATKAAVRYRKGACENCGALTHKKKDCMDRPRKIGAKYSGANIAPDEYVQNQLDLSYDGKRDRWSGYDPAEHKAIVDEYQKIEEAKRQLRADKLNANEEPDEDAGAAGVAEDEDKYVDEVDMPGTKVDSKQRITVRNLRIREDTAKYLRNLDPNSAYYDPKTRSMRENPNPAADAAYSGENFVRFTGDTQKHAKAQLFAWEAYERGVDVHLLAEPTKLELLQHEYDKKKEQFKSKVQEGVLEKYGGEEHLRVPPKSLLLAQTEDYVEYSRAGKVLRGQEKPVVKSRWEEDVLVNNHTAVWGSFWRGGEWGYKCCHSFIKNSYCLGEAGKAEAALSMSQMKKTDSAGSSSSSEEENDDTQKRREKRKKKKQERKKKKDALKEALRAEEEHQVEAERLLALDERKRPYNSMYSVKEPTEEEIEAYHMKRRRDDDPMNQFI